MQSNAYYCLSVYQRIFYLFCSIRELTMCSLAQCSPEKKSHISHDLLMVLPGNAAKKKPTPEREKMCQKWECIKCAWKWCNTQKMQSNIHQIHPIPEEQKRRMNNNNKKQRTWTMQASTRAHQIRLTIIQYNEIHVFMYVVYVQRTEKCHLSQFLSALCNFGFYFGPCLAGHRSLGVLWLCKETTMVCLCCVLGLVFTTYQL